MALRTKNRPDGLTDDEARQRSEYGDGTSNQELRDLEDYSNGLTDDEAEQIQKYANAGYPEEGSDDANEDDSIDWENYDEDNNPVDDYYAKRLGKAEQAAGKKETNSEDIEDQEDNPGPVPGGVSQKKQARLDKLRKAFMRGGPTAGIIGVIVGTFGLSSVILGPASLLVNLSDLLTNHSDHSKRLFTKTSTSYVKAFLLGQTRDCTGAIKCKFATISENRLNQWRARGIDVEAERSRIPGITGDRYKVRAITYKGTRVNNIFDYKALRYTYPEFNSLLKRFPIRASYINTKSTLTESLKKFKPDINNRFVSSKAEEKSERKAENGEKMNAQTGAEVDEDGKVTRAGVDRKAESKIKSAADGPSQKLKSPSKALAITDGVSTATVVACMYYDLVRATQAAITLTWHNELISFALPFLQAGAQAKEAGVNGGFDWQTAEYFGDRLTTPVTQRDIDENPDLYTQDMLGKTMMDSKGIGAALHGDHASLTDYAGKYTSWAPNVWSIGMIKTIQEQFGKDNIRNTCNVAKVTSAVASVLTCAASLPKCALIGGGFFFAVNVWGDDIVKLITDEISEPALDAIADANLSDSLVGPPGGEALVGAAGVLASYQDRAAGFAAAGTDEQAYQAYNDMVQDEEYQSLKIAEAREKASKNQFDLNNPYSFAGRFAAQIVDSQWNGSVFSVFSNIMHTVASIPKFGTAFAAKDGVYMPIEIYDTREQFEGALENCADPGMKEIGVPCVGESGRPIPYLLPVVDDCIDEETNGGQIICINKAIEYLGEEVTYTNDENEEVPYIDPETGEPSDWDKYKEDEKYYKNPFLMYMRYCGVDRVYPLGYTDTSIEEGKEKDDWYIGRRCATSGNIKQDTDLAWMSYYYNMCIALYASEENIEYCWEDTPAPTTTTATCGMPDSSTLGDFATGNGTRGQIRMILVHTTEGDSLQGMASALRSGGNSYHVAIDESGQANRLVSDDQIANGARGANTDSLNIALVGFADKGARLDASSPQLQTLSACIADWSSKYSIPLEKVSGTGILNGGATKGVAGHIDVAQAAGYNDRTDPGRNFPWSEVLANAK